MKGIKVVCGIIWKDGKILIARRKPKKALGGYWEFPGGKIESGEVPEKALERELYEEMGMIVSNIQYYKSNSHQYDSFIIELIAYECEFVKASFKLKDHDEYLFVSVGSMESYNLAPADMYFVECLKKG